jgi:uncharacterized protein YndB with AHSA1/START domain
LEDLAEIQHFVPAGFISVDSAVADPGIARHAPGGTQGSESCDSMGAMAELRLHTERRYEMAVRPPDFWRAISKVERYRSWWPWLREFDGERLESGATWRCSIRAPLRYRVHFELTLEEVEPHNHVAARISGDVKGTAALRVRPNGQGSHVQVVSTLVPSTVFLRTLATVLWPVARYGHNWILDTGMAQLAAQA